MIHMIKQAYVRNCVPSVIYILLPLALQPTVVFGLSNKFLPFFSYLPPTLSIFSLLALEDLFLLHFSIFYWVFPFFFFFSSSSYSSSYSPSIDTTAHCGLWPVEQYPSIFSNLLPTLSIFSLPTLEDLILVPLSHQLHPLSLCQSLPLSL